MTDTAPSSGRAGAVVLAGGSGTRMPPGGPPKVLRSLLGKPLVEHVLDAIAAAGLGGPVVVVVPAGDPGIARALAARNPAPVFAAQPRPDGTAGALAAAEHALAEAAGAAGAPPPDTVLVLCGDAPLVRPATLGRLLAHHRQRAAAATVLTARLREPGGYGRIVRGPRGELLRIVEEPECSPAERAIEEVNAGVFALATEGLWTALASLPATHAKGERYLTDLVALLAARGQRLEALLADDPSEALGVNTLADLAAAGAVLRRRHVEQLLAAGVEIPWPDAVWIEADVTVAPGARIEPFTVLRRGVRVGPGAVVGPFAHLGPGAVLQERAEVGNFVEVKRTLLGAGAKAKHLAYLGDGTVGAGANIGAGTIFCNYDGRHKHPTVVGAGAQIGSGTLLVAPVEVGAGARTGAGAVVTRGRRIPEGETWVGVPAAPLRRPAGASGAAGGGERGEERPA
ncbi:MAG: bifunctional protein GlmU [Planctomycetota bacterium]|nr:MAG: bifunctional protein GlmU [Planctomycetota bacterium]